MATAKKNRGATAYLADAQSPEAIRRRYITDPANAALTPGLALGQQLMALMRVLPDAFAQSQERELARLKRQGKEAEGRRETLARSIGEARALADIARRGQARAERLLEAGLSAGRGVHGFVSDREGQPLAGLRVRVLAAGREHSKPLEATTADDGYFRIALPGEPGDGRGKASAGSGNPAATPADGKARDTLPGQVEILSRDGKTLHADPAPVELAHGSPYREYLVGAAPDAPRPKAEKPVAKPPKPAAPTGKNAAARKPSK